MKSSVKKRIAVLHGGPSSEHYFSLQSSKNVLEHLDKTKYIPVEIYIDIQGKWYEGGVETNPYTVLQFVDIVYNALHGEYGEDGTVQALMDSVSQKYTGSEGFTSKIVLDKHITKLLVADLGVKVLRSRTIRPDTRKLETELANIWRELSHPVVVKPVGSGSSVGVSVPKDYKSMCLNVKKILLSGHSVMVEEYVKGTEVSVCVINNFRNQEVYSTVPVQIKHNSDLFDNIIKKSGDYILSHTSHVSHTDRELTTRIAKHLHRELGLRHYSSVDFIINKSGIYFLEINALPGLTKKSILPFALSQSGVSMKDFLTHVIDKSVE